jgi:hypothetical protein
LTGAAIEQLQRFGLKLFAADGANARPREFVPVFHRWIQSQAIADQLLVDVADYAHVVEGPGVLLVAHEGNFSVDLGGGRMGLAYYRKTPAPGSLLDRLLAVTRTLLEACRRVEDEPTLAGRIRFRGDQIQLFANDRLNAPNHAETVAAFRPTLDAMLRSLYGDAACTITAEPDPHERFGVHVQAAAPVDVGELLARLQRS